MEINFNNIPDELKSYPNWVNWRIEERHGKPTKIPINPKTQGNAMSDNPSTWGAYEQAVKRYQECENEHIRGIGFMLSNGYAGSDLDHCYNPSTGEILSWAKEVIEGLSSYAEITPSNEGLRVLVKGKLPEGRRVLKGLPSIDGANRGEIALYDSARFFTVTGNHLPGTPLTIEPRESELAAIHAKVFGNNGKPIEQKSQPSPCDLSDDEILNRARNAKNGTKFDALWSGDVSGYPSPSEADIALCLMLAFWTGNDAATIDRLFKQSGLYRQKWDQHGYNERTIQKAISLNTEVYSPPKQNPKEKDQAAVASLEIGINLTDLGNARRFVAAHGKDLRYCYPWGKWLSWDGRHWIVDDMGEVNRKAKDTILLILKEAASEKDDKKRMALASHALRCESDGKLRALVELAKSEPGIPIKPDEMDRDPWLLNVANGTINLLTGELYPHERDNLITKQAPVEYETEVDCPYWSEHLKRIMNDNKDLISFLQRGYGYSLTGITDERIIMIQHGSGANGKTTTNEVIALCLGDYAVRTPTETLLVKREGSIPNDLAKLKGARFVFCSEADEGKRLGESLIKDLTGGDTIAARFMRGEWFEFQPTFKIWLATNHKPIIRGTDNAIWDRIRLIPFVVSIPESERIPRREMMARFEEELSGILGWMVKGCLDWQKSSLGTPEEVREATNGYRAEMDVVGDFIEERCVVSNDAKGTAKALYEAYIEWAKGNGEKEITQRFFGGRLTERGFTKERTTGGTRQWVGIGLEK